MNIVIAISDRTEGDRCVKAVTDAGHCAEGVVTPAMLLQAVGTLKPQVAVLDWDFGGNNDLIKSIQAASASELYVVLLIPGKLNNEPTLAQVAGAHDFIRRPLWLPELLARLDGFRRSELSTAARPSVDAWKRLSCWRHLEATVAAELSATIGQPLVADHPRSAQLTIASYLMLSLPGDGIEIQIGLGIDETSELPLGVALCDGSVTVADLSDAVAELANTSAGAFKRSALNDNKNLTMGLPHVLANRTASPFTAQRQWRVHNSAELVIHCVANIRSTTPEMVQCSVLRPSMIVNKNILSTAGTLLIAQGTRLSETSIERLRSLLGDREAIEVTMPGLVI